MRYVLKRKADGMYYSKSGYAGKWTPDLQKAWCYKQKGGPKNTLYGLGWLPYERGGKTQTKEDRKVLRDKLFVEEYQVLEVELRVKK